MKHIVRETNSLYEIKDSKFYGFLIPIYNQKDVKSKIDELKELYPNATHYCYAYIINGHEKAYDDKEPSGTAGIPILNILKNNDLNYTLGVVIRYFGGTKLGASNLLRAYMTSMKETLSKAEIRDIQKGYVIEIKFDYNDIKNVNNILRDENITFKEYDELITYNFITTKDLKDELNKYIKEYKVLKETII